MATTRRIDAGLRGSRESVFVVSVDGQDIGLVTKFRDTRTEKHPWKAYLGIGERAVYLGAHFEGRAVAARSVEEAHFVKPLKRHMVQR